MEVWKDIAGFEGLYAVSDQGRVKSFHGRGGPERIIVLTPDRGGYLSPNLYKGGRNKRKAVHLLVLEAFVGPRPIGMDGCHNDGDENNNAKDNLRWDTPVNNHADKIRHGTALFGSKNHATIITEEMAREIKARLAAGGHGIVTNTAKIMGVKRSLVSDIRSGRAWVHVV